MGEWSVGVGLVALTRGSCAFFGVSPLEEKDTVHELPAIGELNP